MLPTSRVVEEVLLRGGAAEALSPGSLWIDMSTSTPAEADRVAEEALDARGVRRLDAPVSGMARGAEAGCGSATWCRRPRSSRWASRPASTSVC
ncbi:NAD(P)-binding domain-containing protein [Amycolatopsis sp. lyj-109]|uniref:NAD(P)-binding domain-containing protein n=1 Tax=Amycolatopsis sp. lyj-109 TaxID=2789287 RepID=UPI00397A5C73